MSNQGMSEPDADTRQGSDAQQYGMNNQYARDGSLNEGYGASEQMGEDQWTAQPAKELRGTTNDQPNVTDEEGLDNMAGGMFGDKE